MAILPSRSILFVAFAMLGCGAVEAAAHPSDAGDSGGMQAETETGPVDPLTGIWSGELKGHTFDSGSTRVVFTIEASSDGTHAGILKLGGATPPPLTSDPDIGYPPGITPSVPPSKHFYGEGFLYHTTFFSFRDSKLDFEVILDELWSDWCGMQTPIDNAPSAPGTYGCLPRWAPVLNPDGTCAQTDPTTHSQVVRDCGKLTLCSFYPACLCKSSKCVSGGDPLRGHASVELDSGVMSVKFGDDLPDGLDGSTAILTRTR